MTHSLQEAWLIHCKRHDSFIAHDAMLLDSSSAMCVLAICARDMTHSYVHLITQFMHTCAILLIRLPYDTTQLYVRLYVRHSAWRMNTCAILLDIPICTDTYEWVMSLATYAMNESCLLQWMSHVSCNEWVMSLATNRDIEKYTTYARDMTHSYVWATKKLFIRLCYTTDPDVTHIHMWMSHVTHIDVTHMPAAWHDSLHMSYMSQ